MTPFIRKLVGAGAVLAATTPLFAHIDEHLKITASDGVPGDLFGNAVAISGDFIVVGAPAQDINGVDSGSVYVFGREGLNWVEHAKLLAFDGAPLDRFGDAVSVSGHTIAIAAPKDDDLGANSGAVYVYVETAGVWSLEAKLLPLDGAAGDEFGTSVDIEGERILVGAPRRDMVGVGVDVGAAYVFQRSGTVWTQEVQLLATDPSDSALYGYSVAIAAEDHVHTEHADLRAIVGAPQDSLVVLNGGSAYSVKLIGVTWSTEAKLTDVNAVADDRFGTAVDMMGSMAIVGSPGDDDFVPDGGSIFAFEESNHAWPQTQHKYGVAPTNPTRLLGSSVAIGHETVMAGAPREEIQGKTDAGEVYLWFTSDPLNWEGEVAATETPADNAHLGASVATSGQWMVSGADRDSVLGPNSGSVSIYPSHQHFDPYCTAGTSASGCQALMGATGIPSASAPSGGFVAFAHDGVPQNDGLFLYSSNGQQALPWGASSSYKCVVPPLIRTPVKKSTGTIGQCDGVATIDLNAFWGKAPAKNPGEGALINIQYWYRDPLNTSGTPSSLSNGLSVEVGP